MNQEDQMNVLEGLWTYATVAFALFIAHLSTITAVGGFILLLLRLTYELPKAVRAVRAMLNREKLE